MRRRDLLASLASLGVVGGGGVLALRGPPSVEGLTDGSTDGDDSSGEGDGEERGTRGSAEGRPATREPLEIETIEATGSRAGTVTVPESGTLTFIDFFATWCSPCKEQMPALAEASDRAPPEVRFLSVTNEPVGRTLSADELRAWWDDHGGNWLLGVDRTAKLSVRYGATSFPTAVIVDGEGRAVWSHRGVLESEEILAEVRAAAEETG